ncbi:hypothetical protein OSTOST_01323, partial [Ostertagia ostertagi]
MAWSEAIATTRDGGLEELAQIVGKSATNPLTQSTMTSSDNRFNEETDERDTPFRWLTPRRRGPAFFTKVRDFFRYSAMACQLFQAGSQPSQLNYFNTPITQTDYFSQDADLKMTVASIPLWFVSSVIDRFACSWGVPLLSSFCSDPAFLVPFVSSQVRLGLPALLHITGTFICCFAFALGVTGHLRKTCFTLLSCINYICGS